MHPSIEIKKSEEAGWIAALARDSAASHSGTTLSKEERIERRKAKKKRREERKIFRIGGREFGAVEDGDDGSFEQEAPRSRRIEGEMALNRISEEFKAMKNVQKSAGEKRKRYQRPWTATDRDLKGKATSGQKKLTKSALQPRKRDYGGLGLARPSLFLDLHDPSFVPKFEEEFAEHVPGFFGKQRTKAMKKQLDGDMLWRRLADEKKAGGKKKRVREKVGGKKLADMSPDERVEAMMKAGMI